MYDNDYKPPCGLLEYVSQLPQQARYNYPKVAIAAMLQEGVSKWHELERQQRNVVGPVHFFALFIYTCELTEEGSDQIYGAMNACMRNNDKEGIEFWRPLIYYINTAMWQLPRYEGCLYRGINLLFDETQYRTGANIVWPAFSSASRERSVAEVFASGTEGTLFFLNGQTCRDIAIFSRFPSEGEVLFHPNTNFLIGQTMFHTTTIGAFYAECDNIAMEECEDTTRLAAGALASATPLGLEVVIPPTRAPAVVHYLKDNLVVMRDTTLKPH
eukprot:NODE_1630_length_1108_cov_114.456091_g1332_i0.p1 GENE.NODE_1630_length_1108_cov_114.456091_g1332_i0~~NODE_1630_length_1108_cov_114.456091_g1332_i0.p1  ORF type:complete len:271 (+),score=73.13 NODE_1630_length_1108_cov_114.456091_g1332_i0:244-1056(+)